MCVILLFKRSFKPSAEMLSIGPLYPKSVMCLMEEIHVLLVELHSVAVSSVFMHQQYIVHLRKEQDIHQSV